MTNQDTQHLGTIHYPRPVCPVPKPPRRGALRAGVPGYLTWTMAVEHRVPHEHRWTERAPRWLPNLSSGLHGVNRPATRAEVAVEAQQAHGVAVAELQMVCDGAKNPMRGGVELGLDESSARRAPPATSSENAEGGADAPNPMSVEP